MKLYTLARTRKSAIKYIKNAAKQPHAIDFETTSLDPKDGRARLISIAGPRVNVVIDFDRCGALVTLAPYFMGGEWIVFNNKFEGAWFLRGGVRLTLLDVGHLRRACMGGGGFSLKMMALWDLSVEMAKEEQLSDWNGKLTQSQLDYAWMDSAVTMKLWDYWMDKSSPSIYAGFRLINDMWPAVLEMEQAGMHLDKAKHRKLIRKWTVQKQQAERTMRSLVSADEVTNLRSDAQLSDYFVSILPDNILNAWPKTEKVGRLSMKGRDIRPIALTVPYPMSRFLAGVQVHRKKDKLISSFGEGLINKAAMDSGRVHARFNIAAAKTGRFSCSSPNLQQVPHDPIIRSSFTATTGRRIVKADYSLIEMRVLAMLSDDEQLLTDCMTKRPNDVHTSVAAFMTGKKPGDVDPWERTGAKKVGFGIVYGSGAAGLALNMRLPLSGGRELLDKWEARYPNAFAYRYKSQAQARRTGYLEMVSGRQVWVGKKASLPICANYPIQGGALDVMAGAVTHFKRMLNKVRKEEELKVSFLGTIHDELVAECEGADSRHILDLMFTAMQWGWQDMFPGSSTERLVEGGWGSNWGNIR